MTHIEGDTENFESETISELDIASLISQQHAYKAVGSLHRLGSVSATY
ncbi:MULTISPECIES: hypothetical protein [Nostocales]|uniref:Uncharacterized protein n=3 Tax=Nostocales TaxID=1161 RepID=A0A8S9TD15_9CYAN|nr:hypothetical protein [Tolypothrix bouteillei]KAF3889484.1 hypothetical protein DA73_0400031390 [Tolypothrix bouteillei VB521301]